MVDPPRCSRCHALLQDVGAKACPHCGRLLFAGPDPQRYVMGDAEIFFTLIGFLALGLVAWALTLDLTTGIVFLCVVTVPTTVRNFLVLRLYRTRGIRLTSWEHVLVVISSVGLLVVTMLILLATAMVIFIVAGTLIAALYVSLGPGTGGWELILHVVGALAIGMGAWNGAVFLRRFFWP